MGGGYMLAFNTTGHTPLTLQGAPGYWAASATGLGVAGLALTWLMAHTLAAGVRRVTPPSVAGAG
jgi:MATE family multidrug resistance protein